MWKMVECLICLFINYLSVIWKATHLHGDWVFLKVPSGDIFSLLFIFHTLNRLLQFQLWAQVGVLFAYDSRRVALVKLAENSAERQLKSLKIQDTMALRNVSHFITVNIWEDISRCYYFSCGFIWEMNNKTSEGKWKSKMYKKKYTIFNFLCDSLPSWLPTF